MAISLCVPSYDLRYYVPNGHEHSGSLSGAVTSNVVCTFGSQARRDE